MSLTGSSEVEDVFPLKWAGGACLEDNVRWGHAGHWRGVGRCRNIKITSGHWASVHTHLRGDDDDVTTPGPTSIHQHLKHMSRGEACDLIWPITRYLTMKYLLYLTATDSALPPHLSQFFFNHSFLSLTLPPVWVGAPRWWHTPEPRLRSSPPYWGRLLQTAEWPPPELLLASCRQTSEQCGHYSPGRLDLPER